MKKRIFYFAVPISVFIIGFITLDILLGSLYSPSVKYYRKPHDYYHHDLVPNVSNVSNVYLICNILFILRWIKKITYSFYNLNFYKIPLIEFLLLII